MATFPLEFVSPDRRIFSGMADSLHVPGAEGDFEVLPGHQPTMSALRAGVVSYGAGGTVSRFYVRGGFVDFGPLGASVLAERCMPLADLDAAKLDQEIKAAGEDAADASDGTAKRAAEERLGQLEGLKAALEP
ncbi:MAG: ATP synthase F1 subunit epsilon [Hyphomicrobiales bacterium]|nr:ATP synthase F1 subunit epsilon [Hyphomicrobiales bacterium]MDE2017418.1 ATP synthase F1 subunit epsilon [Hyphomicrobiales bacterium]